MLNLATYLAPLSPLSAAGAILGIGLRRCTWRHFGDCCSARNHLQCTKIFKYWKLSVQSADYLPCCLAGLYLVSDLPELELLRLLEHRI